jgi:hypothetical protein
VSVWSHLRADAAEWWRRFWGQPNKQYRNFQIVFFLLGVHFLIPSLTYAFNPQGAIGQLKWLGSLAGATDYPYAEDGFVWRILAAGNVFTLAFMCFMIQANVRRFYAVLVPLCVMKAYASLGFLTAYLYGLRYPVYLGVFCWDGINVLMFLYFAHTAYWSLEEWGQESAVPRLLFRKQSGPAA